MDFSEPLREQDADRDPHRQFAAWFAQAQSAGERAPEAAALATATPEGSPSVRMVLVKAYGPAGYLFYSNYESRKGSELARNPRAALLFHWDLLGRQIRLEGGVERLSAEASAAYVRGRPRGSQVSALASPQSRPVADREVLEQRVTELAATYEGTELPVPGHWGGFRLLAERIEFWQHREDRLHDRLLYARGADGWTIARLAP
jgi:pyridoxamine 5'-phosphate oxidase